MGLYLAVSSLLWPSTIWWVRTTTQRPYVCIKNITYKWIWIFQNF